MRSGAKGGGGGGRGGGKGGGEGEGRGRGRWRKEENGVSSFYMLRHLPFRKKIVVFISSRIFEYFIVSLIVIYCILVFISFGITDIASDSDELQTGMTILIYVELGILSVFVLEITANMIGYGCKVIYFGEIKKKGRKKKNREYFQQIKKINLKIFYIKKIANFLNQEKFWTSIEKY